MQERTNRADVASGSPQSGTEYIFVSAQSQKASRRVSLDLDRLASSLQPGLRRRSATAKILGSARLEERNRTHPSTHLIEFAMIVKRREEWFG
jgi:hypothetical protein